MKRFLRPINAAAMRRSDLAAWAEDRTVPVMEALAQLYLFPNTEYENHWRQELYAAWNKVKLLKNNKLPSKEFLIKSTLDVNRRIVPRLLEYVIGKEYTLTPRDGYTEEEYLALCEAYFDWLCELLSTTQLVPRPLVDKKLDEMGL